MHARTMLLGINGAYTTGACLQTKHAVEPATPHAWSRACAIELRHGYRSIRQLYSVSNYNEFMHAVNHMALP